MELKKGMKVRYIGKDVIAYEPGRIYEVLDIDDELFILPLELFEIADEKD